MPTSLLDANRTKTRRLRPHQLRSPHLPRSLASECETSCKRADGKAVYARSKSIVEPALGQIKGARGFRRFSLRSFFKVRAEWTLVCLTHNLLKLYRSKLATVASV